MVARGIGGRRDVTTDNLTDDERRLFARVSRRIIPFMVLLYTVSFLDRVIVGFAALTMNHDLGFSPQVFGFGAGIFFFGYFIFEVPSNLALQKVGARLWMCRIMVSWGLLSMATAFVKGAASFYALRFFLGAAEAGLYPGMILYMTYWFPQSARARFIAFFLAAVPLALVFPMKRQWVAVAAGAAFVLAMDQALIFAEVSTQRGLSSAWLAVWGAFAAFSLIAAGLAAATGVRFSRAHADRR